MRAPPRASASAAASPAGPPPITAASKVADVSLIPGHLTFAAAISSPRQSRASGIQPARPIAASFGVQIGPIPDSSRPPMDRTDQDDSTPATPAKRAAALFVHIFTALGAGVALLALLEAVHEHWA